MFLLGAVYSVSLSLKVNKNAQTGQDCEQLQSFVYTQCHMSKQNKVCKTF